MGQIDRIKLDNEIIWPNKNKIGGIIIEGSNEYCQLWDNYIKNNILPVNCFKFIGYKARNRINFDKLNRKFIKINQLMNSFKSMDEKKNDVIIIKDELFPEYKQKFEPYPMMMMQTPNPPTPQYKIDNFRKKQKFNQLWRLLLQIKFGKNKEMNVIETERMYDKWFNFGIAKWIQYIEFSKSYQSSKYI